MMAAAPMTVVGDRRVLEARETADVGFRKVITHIADSGDLRCLNLCMAYGISVPVELAISVNIGGAGLGYTATLIRLVNRGDTMNALKKTMETENQSLFD